MKTSSTWNVRSMVGKILMGLVLAAMIGSIDVVPALGKDDHKRMGKHDNGRYEKRGRGYERNRNVQGRQAGYSALWLSGTSLCPAAGHLCTAAAAGHQYLFPTHLHSSLKGIASRLLRSVQAELMRAAGGNAGCYFVRVEVE